MKMPREILLEQHQAAAPKLDTVRCEVLAELNHQNTKAQSSKINLVSWCLGGFQKIWHELIFPSRRIWAGLAAIWIFIFITNISTRDHSQIKIAKSSPSPEMIVAYRQQEKLLAELVGQNEPREAEPPKTFSPRPRSEGRIEIFVT